MAELIGGSGYGEVQDTAPSSPTIGDTWLDTSSNPPVGKVYADLGSGGQWATGLLDAQISSRATQSDILSDGTPFDGSNIDKSVSSAINRITSADLRFIQQMSRIQFNQSMEMLGFSDGFYDVYVNSDNIDSTTKVLHDTTPPGFINILGADISGTYSDGASDSFYYPADTADDRTLILTGVENSSSESTEFTSSGGDTTITIGGNKSPTNGTVTLSPSGGSINDSYSWSAGSYYSAYVDDTYDVMFFGTGGGAVDVRDIYDGSLITTYDSGSTNNQVYDIRATDTTVFFVAEGGTAVSYDRSDGSENWAEGVAGESYEIEYDSSRNLIYVSGGYNEGTIHALNESDGSVEWEYTVSASDSLDRYAFCVTYGDGYVYTGDGGNGDIYEVDADTGNENAVYSVHNTSTYSVDYDDGFVFVLANGGDLYKYDVVNDTQDASASLETSADSDKVFVNGDEVVTCKYVEQVVTSSTYSDLGTNWTWSTSNHVYGVYPDGGYVAVASDGDSGLLATTVNPSVDIDGTTVSTSGELTEDYSESVSLPLGEKTASVEVGGEVTVNVSRTEHMVTEDPVVEVGTDSLTYSGKIGDGVEQDISSQLTDSMIDNGDNSVSIAVSEGISGPKKEVGVNLSLRNMSGRVVHSPFTLSFLPSTVVFSDDVRMESSSDTQYEVKDQSGNVVTINETDTEIDVSVLEDKTLHIEVILNKDNIDTQTPELRNFAAYFN